MTVGGLCGVVRFGEPEEAGDRPPPESRLRPMIEAAAWRFHRSDARSVRCHGSGPMACAALGGASLAIAPDLFVVADARLARRSELHAESARGLAPGPASPEGAGPRSPSDADLILAAYRAWGTDCPDRLLGEFAFVLWDARRGSLFCARDPVGARPLHHGLGADGALFVASDAGQVLAAGVPDALDGFFLVDFLSGNFREHARSPYAAVRRLAPGHCLEADRSGVRGWRYWRPERGTSLGPLPEPGVTGSAAERDWVQAFRELLETVTVDHLADAGDAVALMTSGGVDSSTVAAFAQALHARGRIHPRPVAVIDVFERLRECDESEHSAVLVEETGLSAEWIVADDLSDLCPDRSWTGPVDSPFCVPGELAGAGLKRAVARGAGVVTTGFGGDSLFDAARLQVFDHVRRGRLHRAWPWIAGARAWSGSWPRAAAAVLLPPLLTHRGRRRLDRRLGRHRTWQAPPFLLPDIRRVAEERLTEELWVEVRPADRRLHGSFARRRQYEHIVGLAQQGPAIEHWTVHAARRGIEARFPLLDRRLAELALAAPLELEARPGPGGSKWLLREAGAGIVPEAIRRRTDKGGWGAHLRDTLCRRLAPSFARRFDGSSRLASLGLIDDRAVLDGLAALCDGRPGSRRGVNGHQMAFVHLLEWWLRERSSGSATVRFEALDAWSQEMVV